MKFPRRQFIGSLIGLALVPFTRKRVKPRSVPVPALKPVEPIPACQELASGWEAGELSATVYVPNDIISIVYRPDGWHVLKNGKIDPDWKVSLRPPDKDGIIFSQLSK